MTSLVIQWIRICLPVHGTWVQSLVQEDPSCQGATKPVHHATATEPVLKSLCSETREATAMRSPCTPMRNSASSSRLEKANTQQDSAQTKINNSLKKKIRSVYLNSFHCLVFTEFHAAILPVESRKDEMRKSAEKPNP